MTFFTPPRKIMLKYPLLLSALLQLYVVAPGCVHSMEQDPHESRQEQERENEETKQQSLPNLIELCKKSILNNLYNKENEKLCQRIIRRKPSLPEEFPPIVELVNKLSGFFDTMEHHQDTHNRFQNKLHLNLSTLNLENGFPEDVHKVLLQYTYINLSNCNLHQIPGDFGNLTNLEYLDLSNNDLHSLPTSLGQLRKLKLVNLQNTRIKNDDPTVVELQRVNVKVLIDEPKKSKKNSRNLPPIYKKDSGK